MSSLAASWRSSNRAACILHTQPAGKLSLPTSLLQQRAGRLLVGKSPRGFKAYHSHEYDQPATFSPTVSSILSSALTHVPDYGFTNIALQNGARDAGFPNVSVQVFPRGLFDLILYYLTTQRLALRNAARFPEGNKAGVGQKVRDLVLHRLLANRQIIQHWQQALALMAQPSCVTTSVHELFLLADEIWYLAGDKSVDVSWYTKRAILSAIYSSSEVFMTTDRSVQFVETERFLDRRLDDLKVASETVGAIGEWTGLSAKALVNVLRSKGLKV